MEPGGEATAMFIVSKASHLVGERHPVAPRPPSFPTFLLSPNP